MKPRKHAELIKAWADGAAIQQYKPHLDEWHDTSPYPVWDARVEYRIKPEPNPEPQKETLFIYNNVVEGKTFITQQPPDRVIANERYCQYMGSIEVLK